MSRLLLLTILLLVGCGAPKAKVVPFQMADPDTLPPQFVVQLHVLGWRERVPDVPEHAFPAVGFRWNGEAVVPAEEADTIAGLRLSPEEFGRWLDSLLRSEDAVVFLDPTFHIATPAQQGADPFAVLAQPRASGAWKDARSYVANWHLDGAATAAQEATWSPGLSLEIEPRVTPGAQELLLHIAVSAVSGEIENIRVADGVSSRDRSARLGPLDVQGPREHTQRLVTVLPASPSSSIIAAHYVKQFRSVQAASSKTRSSRSSAAEPIREVVREHYFYVVSLRRMGRAEKSDLPITPPSPPARYAFTLVWGQWPGAADAATPRPDSVPHPAKPLDPAAVRAALEPMQESPGAVSCALSVAGTIGHPARFEITDERRFVAEIRPDPREQTAPCDLVIRPIRSGMVLEALPKQAGQGLAVQVTAEAGDVPQVVETVFAAPSVRTNPLGSATETYHVRAGFQSRAEAKLRLDVAARAPETWRLDLPWRDVGDDLPGSSRPERVVLFTVKELPFSGAEGRDP